DAAGREAVSLWPQDRAHGRLARVVRDRLIRDAAGRDRTGRQSRERVVLLERTTLQPAHAAAQIRRSRSQHERDIEPAGKADVGPYTSARRPELDDVTRLHRDRRPRGRGLAV